MSFGTRFGVMGGYVLATFVLGLVHGYRPQLLGEAMWWLAPLAPAAVWLAVEIGGWLRRRARRLGRVVRAVGVLAAGGWWLWLSGLLAAGDVAAHLRYGVPSVLTGLYLAALMFGARRASGPSSPRREETPAQQTDLVSQ